MWLIDKKTKMDVMLLTVSLQSWLFIMLKTQLVLPLRVSNNPQIKRTFS